MMKLLKKIFFATVIILVTIVALAMVRHNKQIVVFDYLIASWELPLALLLPIIFFCGVVLGLLAWLPRFVRLKCKLVRLEKQRKLVEQELDNLRTMPVEDRF